MHLLATPGRVVCAKLPSPTHNSTRGTVLSSGIPYIPEGSTVFTSQYSPPRLTIEADEYIVIKEDDISCYLLPTPELLEEADNEHPEPESTSP